MKRKAIFLDRDGTLNADTGFTHRPRDLRLLSGVCPGLRRLGELGYLLFITTNQSGIARGLFDEDAVRAFHAALLHLLRVEGIEIAGVYFCPFHPTEGIGRWRQDSPLRKPRPGMLLQAAAEHDLDLPSSFAIGDKPSDILAGRAAGCRTILVRSGAGGEAALWARPDFVADDLIEAAGYAQHCARNTSAVSPSCDTAYRADNPPPFYSRGAGK